MASVSPSWCYQDRGLRRNIPVSGFIAQKSLTSNLKISYPHPNSASIWKFSSPLKNPHLLPSIKCEKTDNEKDTNNKKNPDKESSFKEVNIERYHNYMNSTSGQLEPASGARASIPNEEYWPEGTSSRVRAARAPEPTGASTGKLSFGKNPGKTSVAVNDPVEAESSEDSSDERKEEALSEYVVYKTGTEEEELSGYDLDKKVGHPHRFVDPKVKKPIEEPLTSEELWWNWRKPEKEQWSRWQRRRPLNILF